MPSPYLCGPLRNRGSSASKAIDDRIAIAAPAPCVVEIRARRIGPPTALVPRPQAVATETKKLDRASVPLELEDGELPLNTFSPKKPFKARLLERLPLMSDGFAVWTNSAAFRRQEQDELQRLCARLSPFSTCCRLLCALGTVG